MAKVTIQVRDDGRWNDVATVDEADADQFMRQAPMLQLEYRIKP